MSPDEPSVSRRRNAPFLIRSVLLISLAGASGACQGKGERPAGARDDSPRVVGKNLNGDYVALEDFRGDVVLLNVWATWCKPCRAELPELQHLHAEYAGKGFTVLGVSVDSERSRDDVSAMVSQYGIRYPVLLDPASRSVPVLEVTGYPTSFLISRDGRVVWRRDGIIIPDDDDLLTNLRGALAAPRPD
jgi:thiol-disulfide isomerase/thioredoxin